MTGILRTWRCQNARCGACFDAWEANPHCPSCKCVRVEWMPAGGHVGGGTKGADHELRVLADMFKMTDMNSADRGRAAKKVNLPPAPSANPGNVKTFSGGFAAAIDPVGSMHTGNQSGAQCVPTANKIDYRVKAAPGNALAPNRAYPSMRSNTVIEASHKQ